jgi:hypothetical protein
MFDCLNDATQAAPYLRRDLNLGSLLALPRGSSGWRATLEEQLAMVKRDGYVAVQNWGGHDKVFSAGLRACGMARIVEARQADEVARNNQAAGLDATTLHLGTSFMSDDDIDRLMQAVLEAAHKHKHPMFVETHRATATQDMKRTLDLVQRWPDVRFNADLSHWYTGHEMTYANELDDNLARLEPVFERVRFMHARIGTVGSIQAPLNWAGPYVDHFKQMWARCFAGFLKAAGPGDYFSFNPELLPMRLTESTQTYWIYYAPTGPAQSGDALEGEFSDRYADAQALWDMGLECFEAARASLV